MSNDEYQRQDEARMTKTHIERVFDI